MIREYISKAMTGAQYKMLSDDGSWYGEIPGFNGAWANCDTIEECRTELEEVLEEWLLLRISLNLDVPVVDGVDLKFRESA
jgi:predicted RNase H-like HicB family nuclease